MVLSVQWPNGPGRNSDSKSITDYYTCCLSNTVGVADTDRISYSNSNSDIDTFPYTCAVSDCDSNGFTNTVGDSARLLAGNNAKL